MTPIRRISEPLGFPEEAIAYLEECYGKMMAAPGVPDALYEAQELLFTRDDKSFAGALAPIYEASGVHRYSADMVFLLLCAQPLKYVYKAMGYSEELYTETVRDLLFKLRECHDVYGIWGTFVTEWFDKFYTCRRFKLGRMQFETRPYPCDEPFRDIYKKGDTVVGCHIPSCGPLTYESVIDSLKQAYDFYPEHRIDGVLPVYCHSWLMYPPYAGRIFPEGSNMCRFLHTFELVKVEEDRHFPDFFRIFNCDYDPATLADMPEDTGLRRRMKQFLTDGNLMGSGFGFILFDGEKILTEQI